VDTPDEDRFTIECCAGCRPLAELVVRLLLEVSTQKLVLQQAGLIPERGDR
jgi:hypothetical protein